MTELFDLAAQVKLARRLNKLLRVDENAELDTSYVTCAEYQLFVDQKRLNGENVQPDHWETEHFPPGDAKKPITGVRASDAENFCGWLTQQSAALRPQYRYRLPTLAEVQEYGLSEKQIGYWCTNGDTKIIVGIELEQWQTWQGKLIKLLARDLQRTLTRARDLTRVRAHDLDRECKLAVARVLELKKKIEESERIIDLSFELNHAVAHADELTRARTRTQDFIYAFGNDLNRIHGLAHDIGYASKVNLSHNLAHSVGHTFDLFSEVDMDLARTPDLAYDFDLAYDLDLVRAINFARDCTIDFAGTVNLMRSLNNEHDYKSIRSHLLLISVVWALLANIYSRASKNQKLLHHSKLTLKQCENLRHEYIGKKDKAFRIYTFFILLDERREGTMPAWEGIRIAREKVDY